MQKMRAGTETFFKGGISECFPRGSNTPFINSFKTKQERIKGEQGRARSISVSCYFRVSTRSTFLRWQKPGGIFSEETLPARMSCQGLGHAEDVQRRAGGWGERDGEGQSRKVKMCWEEETKTRGKRLFMCQRRKEVKVSLAPSPAAGCAPGWGGDALPAFSSSSSQLSRIFFWQM